MYDQYPPSADTPSVSREAADTAWSQEIIAKIALEGLKEQRRARRWGVFFKLALLGYMVAVLALFSFPGVEGGEFIAGGAHTALVEVRGVIAEDTEASADKVIAGLRDAFEDSNSEGIVIYIDSPGGSPVEAGRINTEMYRLREEYPEKPLYAVIGGLCASGGYYVAVAADRIYADKASLVGSIGVLLSSFGFVQAMEKLGIERRLLAAGAHKGLMDPFLPQSDKEVQHLQGLLDTVHRQFINVVEQGRGDRLSDEEELYSGLIWTGEQGVDIGLVDDFGDVAHVAEHIIEAEKIVDYSYRDPEDFISRLLVRAGRSLGMGLQAGILSGGGHAYPQ